MAPPETKLSLKFMVDNKSKKVIFAEAGSEFVDVLLSFLTLPLGTIIRQLNKHNGN
ncbi:hypothetical protein Leryth_013819 [Lithospermum erythrorhizon]|nr:hypothetical protein Leryth_013819 [Lithospermum erythrorhizon]